MQVEKLSNPSNTNEETPKSKALGLAKSALGWLNKVVNDSVQDINDFSALLSAQAVIQEAINKPEKTEPVQENVKNNSKFESEIIVSKSPQSSQLQVKNDSSSTKQVQSDKCRFSLNDQSPEKQESTEQEPQTVASDDTVSANDHVEIESTVVSPEHESDNVLATELLASQMQQVLSSCPDQAKTEKTEETAGEIVVSEVIQEESLPSTNVQVGSEQLTGKDQKSLNEFARSVVQMTNEAASKSELKAGTTVEINPNTANQAQPTKEVSVANAEFQPVKPSFSEQFSEQVVNQPVQDFSGFAKVSQASPKPEALQLSQSFLNLWTNSYSTSTENSNSNAEVNVLNGASRGIGVAKAAENANPSNAFGVKSADASVTAAERQANLSFANISAEPGKNSELSKSTKPLTRVQTLATMERVEAALKKASESKDGTLISLRLDPPDLGSVKVDVSFKEGSLHARISAESAQVLQLLRDKAPELQVTLRKLGLEVDRISVSVNSGDSGMLHEGFEDKERANKGQQGNIFPELAETAALKETTKLDHWIA